MRASGNLGPVVAMLADEVESLKKQLAEILPIKNVKYPAALHTMHRFCEAHPDSLVTVAVEIEDDLKALWQNALTLWIIQRVGCFLCFSGGVIGDGEPGRFECQCRISLASQSFVRSMLYLGGVQFLLRRSL